MQPAKCLDGSWVAEHRAEHAILPVFPGAKSITVLYLRSPTSKRSFPHTHMVLKPDLGSQKIATPAIVISSNENHRYSRVTKIGERSQRAKMRPRDDCLPLEPEIEKIPVNEERTGAPRQTSQESH